jgi:hypothetical protein
MSGVKNPRGVVQKGGRWYARVMHNGELEFKGPFLSPEHAAEEHLVAVFRYKGGIHTFAPGSMYTRDGHPTDFGPFAPALWHARLIRDGKATNFGPFATHQEATEPLSAAKRLRRSEKESKSRSKSQYRGVDKVGNRWRARIHRKKVATFSEEKQAAQAYDVAARKHYGDDAVVNFLVDGTPTSQEERGRHPPHPRYDFCQDEPGSEVTSGCTALGSYNSVKAYIEGRPNVRKECEDCD